MTSVPRTSPPVVGVVAAVAALVKELSRFVMVVAIANQWLLFLPLAYLIGPVLGYGLTAIWLLNVFYRALQAAVFTGFWLRRNWAGVHI